MKTISKIFNKLPLWGKLLTIVVIAIVIYILYRKLMIYLQSLKKETLLNTTTTTGSGTQTVIIDLGAKALQIYDAFYNYWGGLAEDEATAIQTLKSVPTKDIPKLSQIYFSLYAKNLKEDFVKYTDFNEVSFKFV